MNKIIIALSIVILALVVIRFFISNNEDTWICEDSVWVAHGHPNDPQPTSGCGEEIFEPANKPILEEKTNQATDSGEYTGIANPASVYCLEQGGRLDFKSTPEGVAGTCTLDDGVVCDEWAYFRKECP